MLLLGLCEAAPVATPAAVGALLLSVSMLWGPAHRVIPQVETITESIRTSPASHLYLLSTCERAPSAPLMSASGMQSMLAAHPHRCRGFPSMLETLAKDKAIGYLQPHMCPPRPPPFLLTHIPGEAPGLTCSTCFSPLPELLVQALLCSSGRLQQAGVPFCCDAHVAVGQGLQPADDICSAELHCLTAHGGVGSVLTREQGKGACRY